VIGYFDASALVPLYVGDRATTAALRTRGAVEAIATSLLSYAEVLAAFRQARRHRKLSFSAHVMAESRFFADWPTFHHVPLGPRLFGEIRRLLDSHPLKGADAIQLASALYAKKGAANAGLEMTFACDDRRLARAGRREGLLVSW
jgi:predicted nucleic acid-binding protein